MSANELANDVSALGVGNDGPAPIPPPVAPRPNAKKNPAYNSYLGNVTQHVAELSNARIDQFPKEARHTARTLRNAADNLVRFVAYHEDCMALVDSAMQRFKVLGQSSTRPNDHALVIAELKLQLLELECPVNKKMSTVVRAHAKRRRTD